MISTRSLGSLPAVDALRRAMQSMATLDAILCPDWEQRFYSFDAHWGEGVRLGSMRNGSGDELFAHFGEDGCWIKGFAHESAMTPYDLTPSRPWPGVLDEVPPEFARCLREPAFDAASTTFCIWRRYGDGAWHHGPIRFPDHPDPDGSAALLSPLDGQPETYWSWATEYFERQVSLAAVEHVFAHRPISAEFVAMVDPSRDPADVVEELEEIGYPAFPG